MPKKNIIWSVERNGHVFNYFFISILLSFLVAYIWRNNRNNVINSNNKIAPDYLKLVLWLRFVVLL